ncbi:MAG: YdcF family protein [Patescibacteria group bacterium]
MTVKKEALAVLCGESTKNPDGTWRTSRFDEGDKFGALGDRMRVLAASYLYRNEPQLIIALGGKGQRANDKSALPASFVMKKELQELGVPEKDIITEEKSSSTFTSLKNLKPIIAQFGLKKIVLISNRYHLPRVKAMLEIVKEPGGIRIILKEAEGVVISHDPKMQEEIKLAYKSKAMKKRILLEQKGVKDIYSGKYRFK